MAVNIGMFDRIARLIVGVTLITFALGYLAPGAGWNWIGWVGVLPSVTGLVGNCPAYSALGCSTR